jgi:hypothetical protein
MPFSSNLKPNLVAMVLEKFSTPFPGFYLYYPQRKHASPALRALVDYLRLGRQVAVSSAVTAQPQP